MGGRTCLWAVVGWAATAGTVHAGLLPVDLGVSREGQDFRYTYGLQLQLGSSLRPGDYFTVYDFAGYVPGSATQPSGFTFGTSAVGRTPGRLAPADNPDLPNLTWTYTGPATDGARDLGTFSAASGFGSPAAGVFAAQSRRSADGDENNNVTGTPVPIAVPQPPGVPEPPTAVLLAVAAVAAVGARWVWRRGLQIPADRV